MKIEEPYSPDNKRPEDAIREVKRLVKILTEVQDTYFESLSNGLKLTPAGKNYLFDYIYNIDSKNKKLDGFSHYLSRLNLTYSEIVEDKTLQKNHKKLKACKTTSKNNSTQTQ